LVKKTEADDIATFLLPELAALGLDIGKVRIDQNTSKSGVKRGDVWISSSDKSSKNFERDIIALIEAKHRNAAISSADWRDAMAQGRDKASKQGLSFYVVTNCNGSHRYYSAFDDSEIIVDGEVATRLVGQKLLHKIGSSVTSTNSFVIDKAAMKRRPVSETEFRAMLNQLAHVYRSAGITQGDDRIDPTVGFVVLKYISEKELEERTLPKAVKLWDTLGVVYDAGEDLGYQFKQMREMLWGATSEYKVNAYQDFRDLVQLPARLLADHYRDIYTALNSLDLHGASFDVFGSIYEAFASQTKKKEFGEFYTRRHITGVVARLLLKQETRADGLRILDPACGTGGFLTEAFKALRDGLKRSGKLSEEAERQLREDVFWGFDNDSRSVARTKLNMFLVGDGHMHVFDQDSITDWGSEHWGELKYDYVFTNPPMGKYQGVQDVASFEFTNERRMELLFTERIVKATKPGGDIAIVLNDGSLEAPTKSLFRQKLLAYCDVRAIVSLTRFAFAPYTKEKTYVVFMRKKQNGSIGVVQKSPIWHYLVDYDGFANSDKRYRTKYHDDLPELSDKYPVAMAALDAYDDTDPDAFLGTSSSAVRSVNEQERLEGLTGMKSSFVDMAKVDASNYFNLLSEFHLRPPTRELLTVDEAEERLLGISSELEEVGKANDAAVPDGIADGDVLAEVGATESTVGDVFTIVGGNGSLTEEFIYENWPLDADDSVNVLSSATNEARSMGVVSKRAQPGGRALKTFSGPALVVARNGRAGHMQLVGTGLWAITDHAYVLRPKKEWIDRINLEWALVQLEGQFERLTTSNSDNATLSKEYMEAAEMVIPDMASQKRIGELSSQMRERAKRLRAAAAQLDGLGSAALRISN
jgi:type I restriction enzyme M protein